MNIPNKGYLVIDFEHRPLPQNIIYILPRQHLQQ
jgi:hypothetical protein